MNKEITLKELKEQAEKTRCKILPVSRKEIKFATKDIFKLIQGIDKRYKIQRNREVEIKMLDKGIRYPVIFAMMHKDNEVRVMFVADEEGDKFIQDMSVKTFEELPKTMVIDK